VSSRLVGWVLTVVLTWVVGGWLISCYSGHIALIVVTNH
jgi:hypothetical protein